ncbi:MAG: hypothetical protein RI968_1020, partial [Pseudomonadota bacterium]
MLCNVVIDLVVFLARGKECLRGNAAHIQAGTAQDILPLWIHPLLGAGGGKAELSRANCRDVAGRSRADDKNIHTFCHGNASL